MTMRKRVSANSGSRRARIGRPRLSVMGWGLVAFLLCAAIAAPAVFWLRQTMEQREALSAPLEASSGGDP